MDRKTAGLIGTVAGLATMGVAHAAIPPAPDAAQALQVSSYAELLVPVPNARDLLKVDDAARARPEGELQLAQYYGPPPAYHHHHHHHHHHHAYYRHHHHHHHHHNTFVGIPGVGGVVVGNR
ncbi:MAG TPA: hypothetical protein VME47_15205 [Acetobacteraceae bacterium]|nr:hypothetical protein [Acetobacteraceae bacterium]